MSDYTGPYSSSYLDPEEADYAGGMTEWLGSAQHDPANAGKSYAQWVTEPLPEPRQPSLWSETKSAVYYVRHNRRLDHDKYWAESWDKNKAKADSLLDRLAETEGLSKTSIETAINVWDDTKVTLPDESRLRYSAQRIEKGLQPLTPYMQRMVNAYTELSDAYLAWSNTRPLSERPSDKDINVTTDGITTRLFDYAWAAGFETFAERFEAIHGVAQSEDEIVGVKYSDIDAALREHHAVALEYEVDFGTERFTDALHERANAAATRLQGTQARLMVGLGQAEAGQLLAGRVGDLWPSWTRDHVAREMGENYQSWAAPRCIEMAEQATSYAMQQQSQDNGRSL